MKDHEFQCCMVAGWVTDDIQRCASAWGRNNPQIMEVSISFHKHRRWTGFTSNCAQTCWHVRKTHCRAWEYHQDVKSVLTLQLWYLGPMQFWVRAVFLASLRFLSTKLFSCSSLHCSRFAENQYCHDSSNICSNKSKGQRVRRTQIANNFWGARSLQYSWENIRRYNHPQPQVVHISLRFQVS